MFSVAMHFKDLFKNDQNVRTDLPWKQEENSWISQSNKIFFFNKFSGVVKILYQIFTYDSILVSSKKTFI